MKNALAKRSSLVLSVALFTLCGCATQKTLYNWGGYQQQVYQHFKTDGNSHEEQIIALEQDLQKAHAKGDSLPPGYHAHLGMLYAKAGKQDQVIQSFETEKRLFPESSGYIDFLMSKYRNKE